MRQPESWNWKQKTDSEKNLDVNASEWEGHSLPSPLLSSRRLDNI